MYMYIFIYLYILVDTRSSGTPTAPQTPLPPSSKTVCTMYLHVIVIRWRRVVYGLYTSGSVFIGHEGVARVVYQNGSHECITRKPQATPSYN